MPAASRALPPSHLHAVLERAGEREVQLGVLAGQQVVVDDLAQQRVAEGVVALVVDRHHVAGRGLAQGLAQRAGLQAATPRPAARGPGCDRRRSRAGPPGRPAGSASMRTISASRSVGGSSPRPSRPAARSSSVKSGLPSLRAYMRATRRVVGGGAEDVLQLLGELVARERHELDAARARPALELGQQRAQRVAAVQLVGAVGGDEQHALGAQAARQEGEEGARGGVGPVQVLDRQHAPARRARAGRAA